MNLIKSTTLLCMFGISTFARSQKCGSRNPLYACADGEIPLKSNLYIPWNDPDCKLNNKPIRWCCPDDGRMQVESDFIQKSTS
ncbi:hypothetical protein Pst134EA_007861 [Puccinia striiformis f. sp. tritici]|uniref:hypothetical protein n=1 Tax=Puccinia striiformis f. sp. tritici TaxID=168172 RepID=UPI00200785EA|nr:hypothetical protein Pst134EA_007861 [Puccinia striiformis f. sp. tritici]KAH9470614.1 hypothetical protein Pst134EA_007861 [Puccinia striiformis f. sp. tritici]